MANVGLAYGWQINPATGEVFFHSGVDLLAPVGSDVLAIAPGTVAFANDQGSYGKLSSLTTVADFKAATPNLTVLRLLLVSK